MAIDLLGVTTVMLPGTGSDDDYITRAFGGPLRDAGARLLAPPPQPNRLIDGYLTGLDDA
ncbi:MAG: alpha/beta hydrolase, partial [Mycobacterium sp.]